MGSSICDKIKEFFEYINCVSSCCNKTIIFEKKKHHHKHQHEIKPEEKKEGLNEQKIETS
jgi:hypothetical protein